MNELTTSEHKLITKICAKTPGTHARLLKGKSQLVVLVCVCSALILWWLSTYHPPAANISLAFAGFLTIWYSLISIIESKLELKHLRIILYLENELRLTKQNHDLKENAV